jgi:hypothetical protein
VPITSLRPLTFPQLAILNYCADVSKTLNAGVSVVKLGTHLSPNASVAGVGSTRFPLSNEEAKAVVAVYKNGIIKPELCDHAHSSFHPWLERTVTERVAKDLGGGSQPVTLTFKKMVICGNNSHWSKDA